MRNRDRETKTQTERDTHNERETETDRQTDMQTDRQSVREKEDEEIKDCIMLIKRGRVVGSCPLYQCVCSPYPH